MTDYSQRFVRLVLTSSLDELLRRTLLEGVFWIDEMALFCGFLVWIWIWVWMCVWLRVGGEA
jgi:hypothetical protein